MLLLMIDDAEQVQLSRGARAHAAAQRRHPDGGGGADSAGGGGR
jgi:hypothetical protein